MRHTHGLERVSVLGVLIESRVGVDVTVNTISPFKNGARGYPILSTVISSGRQIKKPLVALRWLRMCVRCVEPIKI